MRFISSLLFLLLFACTSVNPPSPVKPVVIPYSNNVPTFNLVVEEIPFLADLDNAAEKVACSNAIIGANAMTIGDVHRLRECQAYYTCFNVPARGNTPAYDTPMYVGQKVVPGFLPAELKAQLTSALGGVKNFKLLNQQTNSTQRETGPLLIKAMLTEYNVSSSKDSSGFGGMGVGPLSILQLFRVKKIQKTGFVRFDMRIVDPASGRIKSAFSVAGSATDAYVAETILSGSVSENEQFVPLLMHQATRAALNEGAKRVFAELTK